MVSFELNDEIEKDFYFHLFISIGRKKTNVQKNNFNRGVPILNKQPDQQR